MLARRSFVLLPVLLLTGCLPLQLLDPAGLVPQSEMVPASPFGAPGPIQNVPVKAAFSPASTEMVLRVDVVRRTVLAANPKLTVRPVAAVSGLPHLEIFHQGTQLIHLTEGLVKRCKNDGELAALLCLELGKMVSERESLSGPRGQSAEGGLPIDVPMGNAGQPGATDQVALAELAKHESRRKRTASRRAPLDPYVLAAEYLEKAGYQRAALDAVAPLLEAADRRENYVLEKHFRGPGNVPGWTPVSSQ
jgi:hypothetical protein